MQEKSNNNQEKLNNNTRKQSNNTSALNNDAKGPEQQYKKINARGVKKPKKNMKPYKKFPENLAYLVENHTLTYLNIL